MRIFVDSSDPTNWQRFHRVGWLYGATTNPLILKHEGRNCNLKTYKELVSAARAVGLDELQIQATGSSATELIQSGSEIATLWGNIVVKIPFTKPGMEAAHTLIEEDVRITLTAAYAAHQMIAAIALGADYIAPYYGRLLEADKDADAILQNMLNMQLDNLNSPRILVASIRSIEQLEQLAASGHDTFTLSPKIAEQFALGAMSDKAAEEFEQARLS